MWRYCKMVWYIDKVVFQNGKEFSNANALIEPQVDQLMGQVNDLVVICHMITQVLMTHVMDLVVGIDFQPSLNKNIPLSYLWCIGSLPMISLFKIMQYFLFLLKVLQVPNKCPRWNYDNIHGKKLLVPTKFLRVNQCERIMIIV